MDINQYSVLNLINLYGNIIQELKNRGIIRTGNLIGDIGEYLVIDFYSNKRGLPNLQAAPVSTKNIDAISINGERYSIKSITNNTTGVFYGLKTPDEKGKNDKKFEYVVIAKFNKNYQLEYIYEINWEAFLKHKKWHSRMKSWNLLLTKSLIEDSKIRFNKNHL